MCRAQYLFHERTEVCGLLLKSLHDLFRFLRHCSRLASGRLPLPPCVFVFCVVRNLTNWIHNPTFYRMERKCKSLAVLF
jgi:hypothetical protein